MLNITNNGAVHTMFANGAVRDTSDNIIGFYDRESGDLDINYYPVTLRAANEQHAMDLVAQHYKPRA
jgi:hypothetical protein